MMFQPSLLGAKIWVDTAKFIPWLIGWIRVSVLES